MKRIYVFLVSLILTLTFSFGAAPVQTAHAACNSPTATPVPSYTTHVLGIQSGTQIAYWPLNETSGTNAADASGHSATATYTNGVSLAATTFPNGDNAVSFDGIDDVINIYSSYYNTNFNPAAGSILLWIKMPGYADGVARDLYRLGVNGSNMLRAPKSTANTFQFRYTANAINSNIGSSTTPTNWTALVYTWDVAANTTALYINASSAGTSTAPSGWTGLLGSMTNVLGANNLGAANPYQGYMAHVALWTTALSALDAAAVSTIPTNDAPFATCTPTYTPSNTYTPTHTPTYTPTFTPTFTPSNTLTPTHTPTMTFTPTHTFTPTPCIFQIDCNYASAFMVFPTVNPMATPPTAVSFPTVNVPTPTGIAPGSPLPPFPSVYPPGTAPEGGLKLTLTSAHILKFAWDLAMYGVTVYNYYVRGMAEGPRGIMDGIMGIGLFLLILMLMQNVFGKLAMPTIREQGQHFQSAVKDTNRRLEYDDESVVQDASREIDRLDRKLRASKTRNAPDDDADFF